MTGKWKLADETGYIDTIGEHCEKVSKWKAKGAADKDLSSSIASSRKIDLLTRYIKALDKRTDFTPFDKEELTDYANHKINQLTKALIGGKL